MKKPATPTPKPAPKPAPKVGRPRSFDADQALEAAMLLFWRTGYEGTSLSELTHAMGVSAPSLYAAFGDKQQLFLAAAARYLGAPTPRGGAVGIGRSGVIIDEAATATDAAVGLLRAAVVGFTGKKTPAGCLLASAAIGCSDDAAPVRDALAAVRRAIEQRLAQRLSQGVDDGELSADTDVDAWAGHVMAVIQGLSTLARDGAGRDKLQRVATAALSNFPRARCEETLVV